MARGAFTALAGWTKFAPLIVAPLWATYPESLRRPRAKVLFGVGFLAATLASFSSSSGAEPLARRPCLLRSDDRLAVRTESPFSLWDWRQYHAAGIPDLHRVQQVLEGLLIIGAVVVAFLPRRKSPLSWPHSRPRSSSASSSC